MAFVVKDGEVKLIEEVIVQEDASSGEQAVPLEETLADPLSVEVDPLGVPSVVFKEDQWLCCPEPTGVNPEVQSIVEVSALRINIITNSFSSLSLFV